MRDQPGSLWDVGGSGNLYPQQRTFAELYELWLDDEITKFSSVAELMGTAEGLDELSHLVGDRDERWRYVANDVMTSLLGVEKPEALFGTRNSRVYHGAAQFPWYESAFSDWKHRQID